MDLGYHVDSEPVDHLSPEAQCIVVYHFFRSARTPVLEHSAGSPSDKTRKICISTWQRVLTFSLFGATLLESALWPRTQGKCWENVWDDRSKERIRSANVKTKESEVLRPSRHTTMPCPCRAMPCCASGLLRQCRILRESPRVVGKNPNCHSWNSAW